MTEERQVDVQAATDGIRQFLNAWRIDLEKAGMEDTPMRVVEAYGEFFSVRPLIATFFFIHLPVPPVALKLSHIRNSPLPVLLVRQRS